MTAVSNLPMPRPDAQTQAYWDGCAAGELRYQSCTACGCVQMIPRALCEQCQCTELSWKVSARLGTVLSFTTVHRAPLAAFKSMVPYMIAIVDVDEGFRLMANALPQAMQGLTCGTRVRIGFTLVSGMAMPVVEAQV